MLTVCFEIARRLILQLHGIDMMISQRSENTIRELSSASHNSLIAEPACLSVKDSNLNDYFNFLSGVLLLLPNLQSRQNASHRRATPRGNLERVRVSSLLGLNCPGKITVEISLGLTSKRAKHATSRSPKSGTQQIIAVSQAFRPRVRQKACLHYTPAHQCNSRPEPRQGSDAELVFESTKEKRKETTPSAVLEPLVCLSSHRVELTWTHFHIYSPGQGLHWASPSIGVHQFHPCQTLPNPCSQPFAARTMGAFKRCCVIGSVPQSPETLCRPRRV